jgi:hypothetical protein
VVNWVNKSAVISQQNLKANKKQNKMKTLKTITLAAFVLTLGLTTSCKKEGCTDSSALNYDSDAKKDDGSCVLPDPVVVDTNSNDTNAVQIITITENITSNTTWAKDKDYILTGRIAVSSGATLTIEAGTLIKGGFGSGANATALVIARGAKIMAEGTSSEPIIFTCVADEIVQGELVSPNMTEADAGQWGGLIVLGNAPISISSGASEAAIEGIPASDANGIYGGSDATDNSGVIKYVSIRHGGANIGESNEINGLTLGGVGSGTVIENVEIVANQDDGIEFFGGTVNVSNVVIWANGDDAIDTDQAWNGTLNNFVIVNPGDEGFELDGPEGSFEQGVQTITNGTLIAEDAQGLIDFDGSSNVNMSNIFFTDLSAGQDVEEYDLYSANTNNYVSSNFEAVIPSGSVVSDFFKGGSDAIATGVTTGTVGANTTTLKGWTWTSEAGKF